MLDTNTEGLWPCRHCDSCLARLPVRVVFEGLEPVAVLDGLFAGSWVDSKRVIVVHAPNSLHLRPSAGSLSNRSSVSQKDPSSPEESRDTSQTCNAHRCHTILPRRFVYL